MNVVRRTATILRARAAVYFYYTARPRVVNPLSYLRRRYEKRTLRQLREHAALFQVIEGVRRQTTTTGCDYADYWALYETVRRLRPACVLECGSGISSAVIAFTLKEQLQATGRRARFVSLEEAPEYHEEIRQAIPGDLAPFVEFKLSPREECSYGPHLGCRYHDVPDLPYDFVFIDGPTQRREPGAPKCFNADLVDLVRGGCGPLEALLDQRIGTYWALRDLLPTARFEYDPVRRLTRIQVGTEHTGRKGG